MLYGGDFNSCRIYYIISWHSIEALHFPLSFLIVFMTGFIILLSLRYFDVQLLQCAVVGSLSWPLCIFDMCLSVFERFVLWNSKICEVCLVPFLPYFGISPFSMKVCVSFSALSKAT